MPGQALARVCVETHCSPHPHVNGRSRADGGVADLCMNVYGVRSRLPDLPAPRPWRRTCLYVYLDGCVHVLRCVVQQRHCADVLYAALPLKKETQKADTQNADVHPVKRCIISSWTHARHTFAGSCYVARKHRSYNTAVYPWARWQNCSANGFVNLPRNTCFFPSSKDVRAEASDRAPGRGTPEAGTSNSAPAETATRSLGGAKADAAASPSPRSKFSSLFGGLTVRH